MSRTLFVGDVHGCAPELRDLLDDIQPSRVVLLGDLFTRGPDPEGVWALIRDWRADAVLGNHDVDVLRRWRPGQELPKAAHRWLAEQPWLRRGDTWIAVHAGVRPTWKKTRRDEAIGTAPLPVSPWWDHYDGRRLVLHGHHARNGLVDRRPHTLGLDTGCVKGEALTGYLLEEDRLVQVPAWSAAAA